jgi:hypothetical protein
MIMIYLVLRDDSKLILEDMQIIGAELFDGCVDSGLRVMASLSADSLRESISLISFIFFYFT